MKMLCDKFVVGLILAQAKSCKGDLSPRLLTNAFVAVLLERVLSPSRRGFAQLAATPGSLRSSLCPALKGDIVIDLGDLGESWDLLFSAPVPLPSHWGCCLLPHHPLATACMECSILLPTCTCQPVPSEEHWEDVEQTDRATQC